MMESKLSQSRWTALFWIFPVLFLIDDVLGLNGYQFTVHGIGIRILLFCLSAASLGLYCVWAIVRSRMTIFRRKTGQLFFWDYWRTLDWFVLGFLVLNAVWATVIPVLVRGNMTYGVKDFTTLLVLVLYFPCVFLIRLGLLQEKKLMRWLYPLLVLLAQPLGTISPWFPIILIGIGGAAHQSWSANIFSTVGDMFPKSAIATVTGIGGMAGGVGSMILQWFAGWLFVYADETAMQFMGFEGKPAGYFVVFCICAVAYLIGWIVMKTLVPKYKPIVLD